MSDSVLEQMATHLEYLGYEVTHETDFIRARHRTKLNLQLRDYAGGILLSALLFGNATAKENKLDYLTFVNAMNQKAAVIRFYADDDGDFRVEAWYPGIYERAKFGDFLAVWDRDAGRLMLAPEVQTFFS